MFIKYPSSFNLLKFEVISLLNTIFSFNRLTSKNDSDKTIIILGVPIFSVWLLLLASFNNLFSDSSLEIKKNEQKIKENKLQHAIIDIKKKYGKNSILKAMNFESDGTARERNKQIGGHSE